MLWWGKGKMAVIELFEELERALVTLSGYVWMSSERCYLEPWIHQFLTLSPTGTWNLTTLY